MHPAARLHEALVAISSLPNNAIQLALEIEVMVERRLEVGESATCLKLLRALTARWPEYSGNADYPVPAPLIDQSPVYAYGEAEEAGRLWDARTAYGRSRRRLLNWLVEETSPREPLRDTADNPRRTLHQYLRHLHQLVQGGSLNDPGAGLADQIHSLVDRDRLIGLLHEDEVSPLRDALNEAAVEWSLWDWSADASWSADARWSEGAPDRRLLDYLIEQTAPQT